MQSRVIYGFITAVSLFTGSIAGPCLPSVSSLSSTENVPSSTTDGASSSTSTVATLSSTEDATSTTGVTSSTEVASTTETITQLSSTSQASSTTSGVSSSTSSVEPIPTFYIYVANTDADSIRGSNPLVYISSRINIQIGFQD
ncbi:hypothetical protein NCS57_01058700 [Fusarium keratoplasticum]|uniref:Uncharacterized protein n=1 Tax=Fusarium keratoplasticum TaxID=1328300 RepID=A0ACC0QQT4_9HYPO|nr:hypothetical protein NCS57_01058700 [Fusarium keratoplasticum]KAI8660804.1 hypothetical protein NCS57_01058700 [Fusarium keratoplasticum]KAI8661831.1 hypothetical protein NCS55_01054400 [Fusarium keratoplasticum]